MVMLVTRSDYESLMNRRCANPMAELNIIAKIVASA
jgi:hypothetical protein